MTMITTKEVKFTKAQMFDAIISIFVGEEIPVDAVMPTADDIVEFCHAQIASLETAKAAAKRRNEAKKAEPDTLRDAVYAVIAAAEEPMTAAEVVLALNDEEASMGRVSNRLSKLVSDGVAFKAQASLKDSNNKTVKRMVYATTPFED